MPQTIIEKRLIYCVVYNEFSKRDDICCGFQINTSSYIFYFTIPYEPNDRRIIDVMSLGNDLIKENELIVYIKCIYNLKVKGIYQRQP